MHLIVAALFMVLLTAAPLPSSVLDAEAAELRTTNPRHYSHGAKRRVGSRLGGIGQTPRTIISQTPKRGVIAKHSGPLSKVAKFNLEASLACREGRLRRLGGGIAQFADNRFAAARARDMSRAQGITLDDAIYVFVNESSTACRVYKYRE